MSSAPVRGGAEYVLYWMVAARRTRWSFSLQRALHWAQELDLPLVVLEALRVDYPWANDRLHRFVLDGMAANEEAFRRAGVTYYPYVEPEPGAGAGLLEKMAEEAAVVVTDDAPGFFLTRMVAAAGRRLPVRLEAVDSNGVFPIHATDRVFKRAYDFRRFLVQARPRHPETPMPNPLSVDFARAAVRLDAVRRRWPAANPGPAGIQVGRLSIDHTVPAGPLRGGEPTAREALNRFLQERLHRYADDSRHPDRDAASGLSPWLHFGHLSASEVEAAVSDEALERLAGGAGQGGDRVNLPGQSASASAFLDQLVTWRELCLNTATHQPGFDAYDSLPGWALGTLSEHRHDERPRLYSMDELMAARTDDALWNAAQRQLLVEGRMPNYLRMIWGKKLLEWSPSPREALERAVHMNNLLALDGRDANSYGGIFWCFGRYDRPWPRRPIFGSVRFMTTASTRKKLRLRSWLATWAEDRNVGGLPDPVVT